MTLDQLLESLPELLADLGDVLNDALVEHDLDVGGDPGDGEGIAPNVVTAAHRPLRR